MSTLTLILGGARSGKSSYGEQLATSLSDDVLFVATAQAWDEDMAARIERHKADRPSHWQTVEAPKSIATCLEGKSADVILIDCITLLVSNLLMVDEEMDGDRLESAVATELSALIAKIETFKCHWIIISNEVGLGIVPNNRMTRLYRDALGRANQRLAQKADKVILMVAGIPVPITP